MVNEAINGPLPVIYTATLDVAYMGPVENILTVEIKTKSSELSWLYGKISILLFDHNGLMYECLSSALKDMVGEVLKEKRFVLLDEPDKIGYIRKDADTGRIVGYISAEDLLKISNEVKV